MIVTKKKRKEMKTKTKERIFNIAKCLPYSFVILSQQQQHLALTALTRSTVVRPQTAEEHGKKRETHT